jgi:hypothetical protein
MNRTIYLLNRAIIPMANSVYIVVPGLTLLLGVLLGMILNRAFSQINRREGFDDIIPGCPDPKCDNCTKPTPCGCPKPKPSCGDKDGSWNWNWNSGGGGGGSCNRPGGIIPGSCPPCREPDLSKYVLKTTIPPCPPIPDLSKYMLKTECPAVPDLSNYVLKSSVPKPQPIIMDCSKCNKPSGECPPCPRPRCPEIKCAPPTRCAPPAPCPRPVCPPTVVKCKAEDAPVQQVRPYLAPLDVTGFGLG